MWGGGGGRGGGGGEGRGERGGERGGGGGGEWPSCHTEGVKYKIDNLEWTILVPELYEPIFRILVLFLSPPIFVFIKILFGKKHRGICQHIAFPSN